MDDLTITGNVNFAAADAGPRLQVDSLTIQASGGALVVTISGGARIDIPAP